MMPALTAQGRIMLKSMHVAEYMSRRLVTFSPDMSVSEAIRVLLENQISGGPVVDETGRVVGVFSESDCLKGALEASYHGTEIGSVKEYMSVDPDRGRLGFHSGCGRNFSCGSPPPATGAGQRKTDRTDQSSGFTACHG
jgi:CBS domain-containing protein